MNSFGVNVGLPRITLRQSTLTYELLSLYSIIEFFFEKAMDSELIVCTYACYDTFDEYRVFCNFRIVFNTRCMHFYVAVHNHDSLDA